MTIHKHDGGPPAELGVGHPSEARGVSAGCDGNAPEATHAANALVDRLNAGEPYAVAFGGQGSAWLETLEELV